MHTREVDVQVVAVVQIHNLFLVQRIDCDQKVLGNDAYHERRNCVYEERNSSHGMEMQFRSEMEVATLRIPNEHRKAFAPCV